MEQAPAGLGKLNDFELIPGKVVGGHSDPVWPEWPKDMILNKFYEEYNGSEGWLENGYLCIWTRSEIADFAGSLAEQFGRDLAFFGSDGGGTMFGFRKIENECVFLSCPDIGEKSDIRELGSWNDFLSALTSNDYI